MINQNPEQIARDNIDKQLIASGWLVQSNKQVNLNAGIGIAVKEYLTDVGPADDENVGRRFARLSGLNLTGSIGILLKAKKLGYPISM